MFLFLKKIWRFFIIIIICLFAVFLLSRGRVYEKQELSYGATFAKMQAENLGLPWQEVYLAMFDELGVKKVRLSAYWTEVEKTQGQFSWEDLDWQINTASQRKAKIILAVGGRLPRWPECHWPEWAKSLEKNRREELTLLYIKEVINRYKDNENIIAWQIENEPFLYGFGECPKPDYDFIDKEIALAKNLDARPIIVTDSGELSLWYQAASRADIFGTSLYLHTYSRALRSYIHYPIKPGFFRFKKNVVNFFASPQDWIVIELQAEPWGREAFQHLSQAEREKTMSLEKFNYILEFARLTGFKEFYLWGVEYWYWEKIVNNNPGYWNKAKTLF